ncbi:MAG: CdaR family protein [Simkaniaceae bacterium]|nr:CdaR family protein [Candidatus Sacchlamyda saccharinae]
MRKIFLDNWQRKLVALLIAIFIWFQVGHSLISSRTISNVPIRVVNIPSGKTISDLQSNGTLTKRVNLTVVGNKDLLDDLTANDLEVVIDAQDRKEDWVADITKRNLTSVNPEIDLNKGLTRVSPTTRFIQVAKLVTEKIPIFITQPIGEAPNGYQFLDIWPYQLTLTVSGPEEVVKRLKSRGVRLTFDLSDITKAELDALRARPDSPQGEEVTFYVPDQWKRVSIPLLSDTPLEIDDPKAKDLRIDFVRVSLIPIRSRVPISLYFPTEGLKTYSPKSTSMGSSPLIEKVNDLYVFDQPLFAKGVTPRFVQTVEQMIQLSITVDPYKEDQHLNWSVEFINPRLLEDRYVSLQMSDASDEDLSELQPLVREEYLRNRFRSYMNRFQLFKADDTRLDLHVKLDNKKVVVDEGSQVMHNSSYFTKEQ